MFDSHCHLADEAFAPDLDAVVERARQAGLTGAICIIASSDAREVARAADVRAAWPAVRFATAVHPHRAGDFAGRADEAARATAVAIDALGAVAIGELGLDYYYDLAPKAAQHEVMAAQVALSVERKLPIIVHTREAMADTVAIIRDSGGGYARGVIHCFTGTVDEARLALDLGFFVSFAGILTFPKAQNVRDAAAIVPLDRVLVETDAPYLAPVPHRGSRNEPAFVSETLAYLASVQGVPVETLRSAIDRNIETLIGRSVTAGAGSGADTAAIR